MVHQIVLEHSVKKNKTITLAKYFALLILLFATLSSFAQTLDPLDMRTDDVKRRFSENRFDILLAGEQEVAVIIQESTVAISKGAVIMLSDTGQTPLGSRSLDSVATLLNQYGWATLLAAPPIIGLSQETSDNAQENNTNIEVLPTDGLQAIVQENFDTHQQQLQLLMQSLLDKSTEYPGFVVVVSEGTTAAWLAKMYNEQLVTEQDAFVSLSAYWPQIELNDQIAGYLANTSFPVLDMYSQWDNKWTITTAEKRRIAAVKALKLHFRQTELIGVPIGQGQHQYLTKQIIGWLTFMGW
jgi:hypothetical protein